MSIQTNRLKQITGPVKTAVQHPYILLLLLFYAVAGIAAGVSAASRVQPQGNTGGLSAFFTALPSQTYHVFPAIVHSIAINLLLYCIACLPRIWPPLVAIGGLSVAFKGFCMGSSLSCLFGEMGLRGLALGTPLSILPALFCMAALAFRILADIRARSGLPQEGLSLRSWGLLAFCILLESAAAPVALRAWLVK
ncbi:MAG: hypothetical protein VB049_04700 [Candidatus Pelethousia sp.]|nr:hypothetical protein [Candidatus Pelethousia sp.]